MEDLYPKYDRLLVGVIAKDKDELHQYAKLFKVLLGYKVETIQMRGDLAKIITDNAIITFITQHNINMLRGWKNHYVINLVNDEQFYRECVLPCTIIHDYLKEDETWKELFN